jgi:ketosteroid isomerase-like protein
MLALLPAGAVVAQGAEGSAELLGLERVWNEAHLHGDVAALDGLWADDLVVTVPKMRVFARADAMAMARSGRMKFERYETSNLHARLYGDAGVVTGRLQRTRTIEGKVVEDDWQFTKVYIRRAGQWKVVAFHASEGPE